MKTDAQKNYGTKKLKAWLKNEPEVLISEQDERLLQWIEKTFDERTVAVENDTADIDWINKDCRVAFSEVCSMMDQLGHKNTNPVDRRIHVAWLMLDNSRVDYSDYEVEIFSNFGVFGKPKRREI